MSVRKNSILYGRDEILAELRTLAFGCRRFDIASYWAGTGTEALRLLCMKNGSRIIVGGLDVRQKAVAMAHAVKRFKSRVRYLEGCHVKLYIFYLPKPEVIIGSMNLGKGMPYEMAVQLTGAAATNCTMHFNNLWHEAEPINEAELGGIAKKLSFATFEQKSPA